MTRERIDELWSRLLAEELLTADEERDLVTALSSDETVRRELLADEELDGMLQSLGRSSSDAEVFTRAVRDRIAAEADASRFVRDVKKRLQEQAAAVPRPGKPARSHGRIRPVSRRTNASAFWWAGVAAALLLVCVGVVGMRKGNVGTPGADPARAATLTETRGDAWVARGTQRIPAGKDAPLFSGDELRTGRQGTVSLRYADGSTVEIGEETSVTLSIGAQKAKILVLSVGNVTLRVTPQPTGVPLSVSTPNAEATVLGTQFTVRAEAQATRLEVQEGRVQFARKADNATIVVGSGQFAEAAANAPFAAQTPSPVVAPAHSPAVPRPLFNCKDLSGWNISHGKWKVENGVVIGSGLPGNFARIESTKSFTNGELVCMLRVTGARVAEVQFGGYRDFFPLDWETPGAWKELKICVQGKEIRGTLDGRALQLAQGGPGDDRALGVLSFYTTVHATLEIKDAQWTESGP